MPRRKEEPPVDINVPIVPMLDMSFQLLSFFILTFRPMPQEGQLSINLPNVSFRNSQNQFIEDAKHIQSLTFAQPPDPFAELGDGLPDHLALRQCQT